VKNIKPTQKRFFIVLIWISVFCGIISFILSNLKDNISYYYTPSEVKNINKNSTNIRIGGMVSFGSIKKLSDGKIEFSIEDIDKSKKLNIKFHGKNVPMIFREGQGVIVKGKFVGDDFIASELITKHDEKYFPPTNNLQNSKGST
jgi:cytochrome c-type biogenesis protein CcmE